MYYYFSSFLNSSLIENCDIKSDAEKIAKAMRFIFKCMDKLYKYHS